MLTKDGDYLGQGLPSLSLLPSIIDVRRRDRSDHVFTVNFTLGGGVFCKGYTDYVPRPGVRVGGPACPKLFSSSM